MPDFVIADVYSVILKRSDFLFYPSFPAPNNPDCVLLSLCIDKEKM